MEGDFVPIVYSGFHDAPLAFLVRNKEVVYLFWRGYFDDLLDDFPSEYEVFLTDLKTIHSLEIDWDTLWKRGIASGPVAKIHMTDVVFDPARQKYISATIFEQLSLS